MQEETNFNGCIDITVFKKLFKKVKFKYKFKLC